MKLIRNLLFFYFTVTIIFLALLSHYKIGIFIERVQYGEFVVNIVDIISSIIIFYSVVKNKNTKLFVMMPISLILLFLMDVQYLVAFYFKPEYSFIIYYIFTYSWYFFTILGLVLLLFGFVYEKKESLMLMVSFLFFLIVVLFYFSPNFFMRYLSNPYYSIDLIAHTTIFYLCVLLIIAIQHEAVLFLISGLCILEIGNFYMTECYLQNYLDKLIYGESTFLLGLVISSVGMLVIIINKLYDPNVWFFKSKTIRNRLSFLIFIISIWSFIIACAMMKSFGSLTSEALVLLPAIGMLYSMITAIASVVISKQLEKPFILIQDKIRALFNGDIRASANEFGLIEFRKLDNFIVESYTYKNALEKHILSMATKFAHDIKSPLQTIENLIKNNKNDITMEQEILRQVLKLNAISENMLNENKKRIDTHAYGFQCLYNTILELIGSKKIEWNLEVSNIYFEYRSKQIIWLNNEQAKIRNILSNLLNNAHEARINEQDIINVVVDADVLNVYLKIQDYGHGIPEEELENVLCGKSLRLDGHGIGLSSAKEFMRQINGALELKSVVNNGTTVDLYFPISKLSENYPYNIDILYPDIVVLDDNPNIIGRWQELFLFSKKDLKVKYFTNFIALRSHLLNIEHNRQTTYLLDYNVFGERSTGLDIIKEFALENVYLITNYAEDIKLQEEVKDLQIKLVPKTMFEYCDNIVIFGNK